MASFRDRLREALFVAPGEREGEPERAPSPSSVEPEDHALRRISGLDTEALREWWDVTLSSVWRHGDEFYKDWDPAHLEEVRLALPMLKGLVDEIEKRHRARIEAVESAGVAPQARGEPHRI